MDFRCQIPCICEIDQFRLQDRELVAAQTGDKIGLAGTALEVLGHRLQQHIARECPSVSLTSLNWSRSR